MGIQTLLVTLSQMIILTMCCNCAEMCCKCTANVLVLKCAAIYSTCAAFVLYSIYQSYCCLYLVLVFVSGLILSWPSFGHILSMPFCHSFKIEDLVHLTLTCLSVSSSLVMLVM